MDLYPGGPPGAAHRVRRHRRRDRRRSTSSTSTTTCSSRGTRRRRSSTRWSTTLLDAWQRSDHTAVAGDQGGRPPLVGPVAARSGSSWPATRCRTAGTCRDDAGGRAAAGRGRRRPPTSCRWWSPPTARCWSSRPTPSWPQQVGLTTDPAERLLRPRRHRRRPGRAGRRGVRRVRGPAHRAGRAHGHRRPGRAELPDRELPRLPGRRLRRPAHRPGPPAGAQVRRRAAHHPRRRRARGERVGPDRPVRRRRQRSTRTPSSWPPACPTGSWTRRGWTSSPAAASSTARR